MPKDLTGMRFSRLQVLESAGSIQNGSSTQRAFKCVCDCGAVNIVAAYKLTSGRTKSCGCLISDTAKQNKGAPARHGHSHSPTYKSWYAMIQRCTNPNNKRFSDWGGRGINVCESWKKFDNFLNDMGSRPSEMTLDRIDPNGNYEKANCRWADRYTQAANKRNHQL